jgi:Histidine kinase
VAGRIDWQTVLPPQPAGVHALWLRGSAQQLPLLAGTEAHVTVLPLSAEAQRYAPWLVVAAAMGGLATAWLTLLRLRREPTAAARGERWLLGLLGAVGLLLPLVEAWRPLWGYDYPWHATRLRLLLVLVLLAACLLPWVLATRWQRLPAPSARASAAAAGALTLAALLALLAAQRWGYDPVTWVVHVAGLGSAAWLCRAGIRREPQLAWPVLTLLLLTLLLALADPKAFLDCLYVIALALLLSLLLMAHSQDLQRRAEQAARAEAQRRDLQARLLRGSMQPHWLMNNLTALQELIETEPLRASELVSRLAEAFDQLRRFSERERVSLQEELLLCRAHLGIVALLRGHAVTLQMEGETEGVALPPGLLHTQVENALTHGADLRAQPAFVLQVQREGGALLLSLRSPKGPGRAGSVQGGTGGRFIAASLASAYGDAASFNQGPEGAAHWCGRLRLPLA